MAEATSLDPKEGVTMTSQTTSGGEKNVVKEEETAPETATTTTSTDEIEQTEEAVFSNEVLENLARQLEYYFSEANLCKDTYLRTLRDLNDGYVPASILANFQKVQFICPGADSIQAIIQACDAVDENNHNNKKYTDKLHTVFVDKESSKTVQHQSSSTLIAIGPIDKQPIKLSEADTARLLQTPPTQPRPIADIASKIPSPPSTTTPTTTSSSSVQNTIILRETPANTTEEEVRSLFASATCPPVLKAHHDDLGNCWFITLDTSSRDDMMRVMLDLRSKTLSDGEPIKARLKAGVAAPPPSSMLIYAGDRNVPFGLRGGVSSNHNGGPNNNKQKNKSSRNNNNNSKSNNNNTSTTTKPSTTTTPSTTAMNTTPTTRRPRAPPVAGPPLTKKYQPPPPPLVESQYPSLLGATTSTTTGTVLVEKQQKTTIENSKNSNNNLVVVEDAAKSSSKGGQELSSGSDTASTATTSSSSSGSAPVVGGYAAALLKAAPPAPPVFHHNKAPPPKKKVDDKKKPKGGKQHQNKMSVSSPKKTKQQQQHHEMIDVVKLQVQPPSWGGGRSFADILKAKEEAAIAAKQQQVAKS